MQDIRSTGIKVKFLCKVDIDSWLMVVFLLTLYIYIAIKITLECNNSIFNKNTTVKIEVQEWVHIKLVVMLT